MAFSVACGCRSGRNVGARRTHGKMDCIAPARFARTRRRMGTPACCCWMEARQESCFRPIHEKSPTPRPRESGNSTSKGLSICGPMDHNAVRRQGQIGYDRNRLSCSRGCGGCFTARALGESILTEAESLEELRQNIRDAVGCHFEDSQAPKVLRLHFVREEVLAL
jgi:hypothetical protein